MYNSNSNELLCCHDIPMNGRDFLRQCFCTVYFDTHERYLLVEAVKPNFMYYCVCSGTCTNVKDTSRSGLPRLASKI